MKRTEGKQIKRSKEDELKVDGLLTVLKDAKTAEDALVATIGMLEAFPDMDQDVMEYFSTYGAQREEDVALLRMYLLALADKNNGQERTRTLASQIKRMREFTRLLK